MKNTNKPVRISIFHDRRRQKIDGTYPVKIRVTYKGDRQYIPLHIDLSKEEYERVNSNQARGRLLSIKEELEAAKVNATSIVRSMHNFNFSEFKRLMGIKASNQTLEWYFLDYISKQKVFKTKGSYQTAFNMLKRYMGFKFSFHHITADMLLDFEQLYIDDGKSPSTVGVYMRCLRAVYNVAKEAGTISEADYPFGRNRYQIPATSKRSIGISKDRIREIAQFDLINPKQGFHRDMWLFSFLNNGMNYKDIAYIRYRNIKGGVLEFTREKSKRTAKQNNFPVSSKLNRNSLAIIERWGNEQTSPDQFVFPIINDQMDEEKQHKTYIQSLQRTRMVVKQIAKDLHWEIDINFMTARHSYGLLLQESDQPLHVIQRAFGHKDPKTTQHYLGSLQEMKLSELASLTEFEY